MDELAHALIGMGPGGVLAGIMFYFLREERAERRDLQKECTQMLRDKIASDNDLASALDKVADRVRV